MNEETDNLNSILDKLQPHQVWDLSGQGLVYMKTENDELLLLATYNTLESAKVHGVIKGEAAKRNWQVLDENARVIASEKEQQEFSLALQQQKLEATECLGADCNLPMAAYDYDKYAVEDWGVEASCPACNNTILLSPRDFELLVGTEHLEVYKGEVCNYEVLHPPRIADIIDAGGPPVNELVTLGSLCPFSKERIPIHLRGRVVKFTPHDEEE